MSFLALLFQDHFIKNTPNELIQYGKQSKSHLHSVSFIKRLMKYIKCMKVTHLPSMNYNNIKKGFLLYSVHDETTAATDEEREKKKQKDDYAHRVLTPSGLLRWMWDVRPIEYSKHCINHNNDNDSYKGLVLPPPTLLMATDIVRNYFLVPMHEKGIHIDEFLNWILGSTGAFMSVKERHNQGKRYH